MLSNGDFSSGLAPWATFGQITSQITNSVFEFVRPPGAPAGVVLQTTGQALAQHDILTALFYLGNSSSVRKRVTVLLHDQDFSDLSACTFWLAPSQPLSPYLMRTFATQPWANATFSLYPGTVGLDEWIRFTDATLQVTPGTAPLGTECIEPGGSPVTANSAAYKHPSFARAAFATPSPGVLQPGPTATVTTTTPVTLWMRRLDLRNAHRTKLCFDSLLVGQRSIARIEISDGLFWAAIGVLPQADQWTSIELDLSAYVGRSVFVRLVWYGSDTEQRKPPEQWRIRDVRIIDQ
jgi:hypothetical protein